MGQATPVIMAVSAVAGAGTALYGAYKQSQAADDAQKIAKRNAELAETQTDEEVRRVKANQEREMGMAKAKAAAVGVGGESIDTYLLDLQSVYDDEVSWMKRTGKASAQAMKDEGQFAANQAKSGALSSIGQAFSYAPAVYDAGADAGWWSK